MALKNIAKLVRQATQADKTPADIFKEYLEQSIVVHERNNQRAPSPSYKPSSLGGCDRRVYFEVTSAPIDPNPSVEANFVGICENGTDRHERLQEHVIRMKEYGIDCEWIDIEAYLKMYPVTGTEVVERQGYEVKLRNTILNLRFMCDGVIKMGNQYFILEIKTETSFKWNKRDTAEDKHKIQASCYALAIGIPDVIFLYEERDFLKKKYYHVHVTKEEQEENVTHKINTLEEYRLEGKVPPKTEAKSECSYCPFTKECKQW